MRHCTSRWSCRSYVDEFGITAEDLAQEPTLPTTLAYTNFPGAHGSHGRLVGLAAAVPAVHVWGYSELGRALAEQGLPAEERYARWITLYAAEEFAQLAQWCRAIVDAAAVGLSDAALRRVEDAFLLKSLRGSPSGIWPGRANPGRQRAHHERAEHLRRPPSAFARIATRGSKRPEQQQARGQELRNGQGIASRHALSDRSRPPQ